MSLRLIFEQTFPSENPLRRLALEIAVAANSSDFGKTKLLDGSLADTGPLPERLGKRS
jgi:hypothetical protein